MTEADWNRCTDPQAMLEFLRGNATGRKLWLFAAACCRGVWHLLADERSRLSVEAVERLADGSLTDEERRSYRHGAHIARSVVPRPIRQAARAAYDACHGDPVVAAGNACGYAAWCASHRGSQLADYANLLRDIFGNPFRPVALDPAWLAWNARTVEKLARAAYEERQLPGGHLEPVRLAILADALEEAGCSDQAVLAHLRYPGPHLRGCFAVDLLRPDYR